MKKSGGRGTEKGAGWRRGLDESIFKRHKTLINNLGVQDEKQPPREIFRGCGRMAPNNCGSKKGCQRGPAREKPILTAEQLVDIETSGVSGKGTINLRRCESIDKPPTGEEKKRISKAGPKGW